MSGSLALRRENIASIISNAEAALEAAGSPEEVAGVDNQRGLGQVRRRCNRSRSHSAGRAGKRHVAAARAAAAAGERPKSRGKSKTGSVTFSTFRWALTCYENHFAQRGAQAPIASPQAALSLSERNFIVHVSVRPARTCCFRRR
jgi:hypothetical protein